MLSAGLGCTGMGTQSCLVGKASQNCGWLESVNRVFSQEYPVGSGHRREPQLQLNAGHRQTPVSPLQVFPTASLSAARQSLALPFAGFHPQPGFPAVCFERLLAGCYLQKITKWDATHSEQRLI